MESIEKTQVVELLANFEDLHFTLASLKQVNNHANIIALNASIEGARTRGRFDSFGVVAEHVHSQASRNSELFVQLEKAAFSLKESVLKELARRGFDQGRFFAEEFEQALCARHREITLLASQEWIRSYLSGGNEDIDVFTSISEYFPGYMKVRLYTKDGQLALESGSASNDLPAKNDYMLKQAAEGRTWMGRPVFCDEQSRHLIQFFAPVKGQDGSVLGVLETVYDWTALHSLLHQCRQVWGSESALVDHLGGLILADNLGGFREEYLDWMEGTRLALAGKAGSSLETNHNLTARMLAFCPIRSEHSQFENVKLVALVWSKIFNKPVEHKVFLEASRESGEVDGVGVQTQSDPVLELRQACRELTDIVAQVHENNNETNMLSVNAAIQAGIAGTEGESFAVVADEIGRLAARNIQLVGHLNTISEAINKHINELISKKINDVATNVEVRLGNHFERVQAEVKCLAQMPLIVKSFTDIKARDLAFTYVREANMTSSLYSDIVLVAANGEVITVAASRDLKGKNVFRESWFKEAIKNTSYVSPVFSGGPNLNPGMFISECIKDEEGDVLGLVMVQVPSELLQDIVASAIYDPHLILVISDTEAKTIAAVKGQNEELTNWFLENKELHTKASGQTSIEQAGGAMAAVATKLLNQTGWHLILARPLNESGPTGVVEIEAELQAG